MIFTIMSVMAMGICYWLNSPWYGYILAELIVMAIYCGGASGFDGDCDFCDFGDSGDGGDAGGD